MKVICNGIIAEVNYVFNDDYQMEFPSVLFSNSEWQFTCSYVQQMYQIIVHKSPIYSEYNTSYYSPTFLGTYLNSQGDFLIIQEYKEQKKVKHTESVREQVVITPVIGWQVVDGSSSSFSSNSSSIVKHKIIYLTDDSLSFEYGGFYSDNNVEIQQSINMENGFDSILNIDDSIQSNKIQYQIKESNLNINNEDINNANTTISVNGGDVLISEYNINNQTNESQKMEDELTYKQFYCSCDQVKDNKIYYYIKNKVMVNNTIYTVNDVSDYKFTVDDVFRFFEDDNFNEFYNMSFIFERNKIDYRLLEVLSSQTSNTKIKQDVNVHKESLLVKSDIDGLLFNNNINLSQGKHNVLYRIKNTAIQKTFTIQVNSKFYYEGDNLYQYNDNDLYKAKFIKNHVISSKPIDLDDDKITIN